MRSLATTVLCMLSLSGAGAALAQSADAGRVYVGKNGETVTIVRLKPVAMKKYVVKLEGVKSELAGVALEHELWADGQSASLSTKWNGRSLSTVRAKGWADRSKGQETPIDLPELQVYVPDADLLFPIYLDEDKTKALKGDDVVAAAGKQKGEAARIAAFSRPRWTGGEDRAFAAEGEEMNKACGAKITTRIDWSTIQDKSVLEDNISVSGYCAAVLEALGTYCAGEQSKKAIQGRVKSVACRFDPKSKVYLDGSELIYTTNKDVSNGEIEARKHLIRAF